MVLHHGIEPTQVVGTSGRTNHVVVGAVIDGRWGWGIRLVVLVAVVGIHLGQGWTRGRHEPDQRQNGKGRTHGQNAGKGSALRCTLLLVESQVVVAGSMKIGTVASRSGLSVKTIRFYCDEGLLHPSGRSDGGYRLFDDTAFSELALIRTLRAMDLPLSDVRRILDARRSGVCTCADLKGRIRSKTDEIGEKIAAMQNLQAELRDLLNAWEMCGGRPPESLPGSRLSR